MLEKADAIFKLALAFAAVLIGASVAYYYAAFLPGQARAETERAQAVELAKRQTDANLTSRREKRAEDAKVKYDACLADAFSNYHSRWEKTCKRLNAADIARRSQCMQNGYDENSCASMTITPAVGCSLANELGDDYDNAHDDAKRLCLDEYKASNQTT